MPILPEWSQRTRRPTPAVPREPRPPGSGSPSSTNIETGNRPPSHQHVSVTVSEYRNFRETRIPRCSPKMSRWIVKNIFCLFLRPRYCRYVCKNFWFWWPLLYKTAKKHGLSAIWMKTLSHTVIIYKQYIKYVIIYVLVTVACIIHCSLYSLFTRKPSLYKW